jgi:hypothetical protein
MWRGRDRNESPMPDVSLWSAVRTVSWLVTMSTYDITSRYQVLCVTWILCEHWPGCGTGIGVVENHSWLKVWSAYCDHSPLVCR